MKTKKWILPAVVLSGTIGIGCGANRSEGGGPASSGSGRESSMSSSSEQSQSRSAETPQRSGQLSTVDMRKVEQALKDKGYDPGAIDGRIDGQSQQAIRDFQKKESLTVTGLPDQPTVEALEIVIVVPQ
jgi:hypothetical protein